MEISRGKDRVPYQNGRNCTAYEYEGIVSEKINAAIIKLSGRYPDKGRAVNETVTELIYVMAGEGVAWVSGSPYRLNVGDQILIEPGEEYFLDGVMQLHVAATPAWTKEQYRVIE